MKTSSGFARGAGCQPTRAGVFYFALILGVTLFATGCGKSKSSAPQTPPPAAANTQPADTNQAESNQAPVTPTGAPPEVAPAVPAPPEVATNSMSNAAPDLGPLQSALKGWLIRNRRVPANFEDFAATAGVTIPPPPPGKKYIITKRMQILLVDR